MIKLKIGRKVFEVAGFPEASAVYQRERNASGEGASTFPVGRIPGHYVSYNGKVWAGSPKDWAPGKAPVFDPAQAGAC